MAAVRPNFSTFGDELEKIGVATMIDKTLQSMWMAPRTGSSGELVANQLRAPRLRRGDPNIQPLSTIPAQQMIAEPLGGAA